MDKLERLLNLTMTLLETARPLTAAELRDRVGGYPDSEAAFRRAFERDKESLREMGIPLTLAEISHTDPPVEGYRIRKEDYYLRDPGFEPDELAALHLAATAVKLDTAHGIEALWKLGGRVEGADAALDTVLAPTDAVVSLPGDPRLGPLFTAVVERRTTHFSYRAESREVDPYRLDFQRGRWYLTGFDRAKGEERNYRVDRIEGDVALGAAEAFSRPTTGVPGGPAQPWQFGDDDAEAVTARLLVDREQAAWARLHLSDDAAITEEADGSIIAELTITNWSAFRSFVLTFLEHAEILSPPALRAAMVDWLEDVGRLPASVEPVPPETQERRP